MIGNILCIAFILVDAAIAIGLSAAFVIGVRRGNR